MTQAEADKLSEIMLEQLNTNKIPSLRLSPLGKKMRTNGSCLNTYVSITEITKEKEIYNPEFQEDDCDELLHTIHITSTTTTLTP